MDENDTVRENPQPLSGWLWAGLVSVAIWVIVGTIILWATGCSAGKDATFAERQESQKAFIDDLREARFKGKAWFRGSGSPFTFGADTHWFLGPPQNDYGFEGEVDFTNPARPVTP